MKILEEAWKDREGPAVLSTVDGDGRPNAIYVGEIQYEPELGFVVADNFFHKTRANIKNDSHGSILFITNDRKAYQAKGPLAYHTDGPVYDRMQQWHNSDLPGVAATVLQVTELFSGAEQLF
ncbi:MAG: pyridoxamine 5'-phosphate oxidase family protein [Candidatus Pacebacteria bacterium]|nr:pyridoxamine 5'-phosphate oxidase family protein [Candidatus Paceibacterota bacterium]